VRRRVCGITGFAGELAVRGNPVTIVEGPTRSMHGIIARTSSLKGRNCDGFTAAVVADAICRAYADLFACRMNTGGVRVLDHWFGAHRCRPRSRGFPILTGKHLAPAVLGAGYRGRGSRLYACKLPRLIAVIMDRLHFTPDIGDEGHVSDGQHDNWARVSSLPCQVPDLGVRAISSHSGWRGRDWNAACRARVTEVRVPLSPRPANTLMTGSCFRTGYGL